MILCFVLSMPNTGSWDGNWSGDSELFAKVVNFGLSNEKKQHAESILDQGSFSYSFGDGWRAGIKVHQIDSKAAAKIKKKTSGFCGYDWMVDSIKKHGLIKD